MTCEPDELIGEYRILASLGTGGSGEVFKAKHVLTHRVDAIKFLTCGRPPGEDEEVRWLREIQLQASLQHPNIAAVHHAFWTPRGLALVMELVEGEPLNAILARGRVPLEAGCPFILQTLAALSYAHGRGIVHRDVKPANMIVTPGGSIKLTDFGLARSLSGPQLTHSGAFAGSPYYMSPEQVVELASADARSDIYSTGVVLYEIATGRRPFEAPSAFQVMCEHRECLPVPPLELEPAVTPELNAVILKALAKAPEQRFQSAAEFAAALRDAMTVRRVPPRKRRAPAAAAAAVLICLAGAATLFAWKFGSHSAPAWLPPPAPPHLAVPPAPIQPPVQPAAVPPPATAIQPAEPSAPLRTRVATVAPPRVSAPPKETGLEPEPEPLELPVSAAGASGVAYTAPELEPPPPATSVAKPPAAVTPPAARPQPPKRRHALWRALGRIAHPLGNKPKEAAGTQPRQ
ncbi:MAG: serine/threonine-protein kinase [Bryobacteraceae bacterium]